ncbi:MAG TPA: DUF2520 domain-containing protein [Gemmatimonadaceae bacterium]|nr:DUF2520 domain-containing protein [Gemmatimonadaceae bacterium]
MSDRVFILGAGRAGRGLSRALRASGVDVVGLHGRRTEGAPDAVTAGPLPAGARAATIVLIAVRDAQLDDALGELTESAIAPDAVILHASGSATPPALGALRARGHAAGTFHPLVPIADPARAAALFRGAFIGLDGDEGAIAAGERLAARLGARTLRIPPGSKATYHAAAVIASNFPTVLAAVASRLLVGLGVPDDAAWGAIRALLHGAVANLEGESAARALTGPIARGDVDTVRQHLDALRSDPATRELYVELSEVAVQLAREAGTDARALASLERLLER